MNWIRYGKLNRHRSSPLPSLRGDRSTAPPKHGFGLLYDYATTLHKHQSSPLPSLRGDRSTARPKHGFRFLKTYPMAKSSKQNNRTSAPHLLFRMTLPPHDQNTSLVLVEHGVTRTLCRKCARRRCRLSLVARAPQVVQESWRESDGFVAQQKAQRQNGVTAPHSWSFLLRHAAVNGIVVHIRRTTWDHTAQ